MKSLSFGSYRAFLQVSVAVCCKMSRLEGRMLCWDWSTTCSLWKPAPWYCTAVEVFLFSSSWNMLPVCLNHMLCFTVVCLVRIKQIVSCVCSPNSDSVSSVVAVLHREMQRLLCCLYCSASMKKGSDLLVSFCNSQSNNFLKQRFY